MNWLVFNEDENDVETHFFDHLCLMDDFTEKCSIYAQNKFDDVYFSLNSYRKLKRNTDNTWRLNAFALDYDYYRISKYKDLSAEEMYEKHIKETLPMAPSMVVDSGRGLYVIYCIEVVPKAMAGFYRRIYLELAHAQKMFKTGIDVKATLATQIIRLPGTYNSKSNSKVEVIIDNDIRYKIKDFEKILPHTRKEIETLMEEAKHHSEEAQEETVFSPEDMKGINERNFYHFKRLYEDFKTLIKLRNQRSETEGYREYMLYATRYLAECSGLDSDQGLHYARMLNRMFKQPMKEHEVKSQCRPTFVTHNRISQQKLIDSLNITYEEMLKLTALATDDIKYDRSLANKKRKARHRGLTTEEHKTLERQVEVVKRLRLGKRQAAIARDLDVHRSTISRDVQFYQDNKYLFLVRLEEFLRALEESNTELTLDKDNLIKTVTRQKKQLMEEMEAT